MNSLPPQSEDDPGTVRLPASGSTVMAEELRNQLACADQLTGATIVDGSAVQTIGQAVLQLLVAARRSAATDNKPWRIINASGAFVETATRCCLADDIGLDTRKAMNP